VPRQEQPQEKVGLEIGHRAKERRESTALEQAGGSQIHVVQPVPTAQIRSTIGFIVEMEDPGTPPQAVVDTRAEMNVLSKRVCDKLNPKPPIKQYVTMTQAGENAKMSWFILGPVDMHLRNTRYCKDLYVTPLQDQML
jgi:hypothetical protein